MKSAKITFTLFGLLVASLHSPTFAQTSPSQLPDSRYDSQVKAQDFIITQEQKGNWAVNCRQRVNPVIGNKRCSATDGRQILKFTAQSEAPAQPAPAQAFEKAAQLKDGYVLQLAAFSTEQSAIRFQSMHANISTRVISTTVKDIQMFNVITPVIENFEKAQISAENTAKTLGYLPWIRTTDSI